MARKLPAAFRPIKNRRAKTFVFAVAMPLLTTLFGSCGGGAAPAPAPPPARVVAEDPATLPTPALAFDEPVPADAPRRIVCLIPSATEALFALGLGDRIVARSAWCDWPPEALRLPSVGRQEDLSPEKVADLRPDLVVVWKHLPALQQALTEVFRLRIVVPSTETKDSVFDGVRDLARAAGVPGRGEALVAEMRRGLDAARARFAGRPRRRVLVVLDRNPLFAPGPASFVDELLAIVGADNVAAEPGAPAWAPFSAEKILDWNPDVVLDFSLGDPSTADAAREYWARFPTVAAVRDGRVRLAAGGVLVRPGPRMAAVAELLGRWIHDG